tara:strand:- start:3786 stop:3965 length:180 start_codon:yes stop_codon:yes gene_type:complete
MYHGLGIEILRIALKDAVERQLAITAQLQELPEQSQLHELVAEQTRLIKETLILFDRIT